MIYAVKSFYITFVITKCEYEIDHYLILIALNRRFQCDKIVHKMYNFHYYNIDITNTLKMINNKRFRANRVVNIIK